MTELEELFGLQDGVVLRSQLRVCEVSPDHVDAQLDARRWQQVGPLVIATHNGPLTYRQQLWAAVLNAGEPAALGARTAAAEAGLSGWQAEVIEIVVPRGVKVPRVPGMDVKVHESRRFSADDVHPTLLPPQTRPERSVLDAAVWTRRPSAACGLVAAAVQQRITTPARLSGELEKAGRVRHARLLMAALADISGGAQAFSEIHFGWICRRNGLPEPERQVVRIDGQGRRRYLDAVLRGPDGRRVIVEIDGAVHLLPARYWDDMSRDNELTIGGERRLRFPTVALYLDETRVVDQIARALGLVRTSRCYGTATF